MRVAKWGNSLAVRIPKDVAQALGLNEGDDIDLRRDMDGSVAVLRKPSREELIDSLRRFRGTMPADYKFDRDEANAR